jgi:hypothetical protein
MYIEYITYSFSMAIGPHFYGSWNITKQKEIEKILQCPSIKSPFLWYGNGFFFKKRYYYAFIVKQMHKNTFFECNFIQKLFIFKLFDWCISISNTIKKFTQEFHQQP